MAFRDVTASAAKGIAAGAAGTVALTAFQMAEMKMQGREASTAPAEAVEKIAGVEPKGEKEEQRLSNATHWAYGTSWGAFRGLLGATGMGEPAATLAFFGAVWGSALTMLPSLDLAPKPQEWGTQELGLDAVRHFVYAGVTSAVYAAID